jgi:hypothetical protein
MINYKAMTFVKTVADVPTCEHWAILEGTSITIPEDQRSREAPGHGYPEHTEQCINYVAFTDQKEFEKEMLRKASSTYQTKFIGIHVIGAYATSIKFEIEDAQ